MDIFNRPPSIAEDTLQYALYPPDDIAKDRTEVTSLAAHLEEFVSSLLPERFLWHKDAFELKVVKSNDAKPSDRKSGKENESDGESWMLEGRMRVGDCVDDEWCVVWLMREISAKWDVAISIWDNDGEFLLIEAADFLPNWITPENSENRVWIYQNRLQLIPLDHVSAITSSSKRRSKYNGNQSGDEGDVENGDDDGWISVSDALRVLRNTAISTGAADAVQDVIWKRIRGYPVAAQQHIHVAKGYLPLDIAKALTNDPSLVQRAVETFYTRDALQLRAANRMNRFPPRPDVLTPVIMTRTAYAQLVGQKFYPPKDFGVFKEREGTKEWRWRDVGMKIACGFEMLYQESKSKIEGTSADALKASGDARLEALRRNPDFKEYTNKLSSSGYFRGELEGSQLWNELEQKAAEVFVNTRKDDNSSRMSFSTQVNIAITRAGEVPYMPALDEDADDWLTIDAEDFDAKLAETMKVSKDASKINGHSDAMDVDENDEDAAVQAQADKLKGFAKKVEKFVEGEGTLEGAMLENDDMSSNDELSDFSDEEFPSNDGDDSDDGKERDAIEDAARKEAMNKLVPPLDPLEYGKMPAWFHSNSQKMAPATLQSETMMEARSSHNAVAGSGDDGTATAEKPHVRPLRRPILTRDKFDGADSDDETDSEEERGGGDEGDESDEDRPQVVGDVEIDMKEEEEEFLEFTRQTLGIDDKEWVKILKDRTDRGAYLPKAYENGAQPWTKKQFDFDLDFKSKSTSETSKPERQPQPGPRPNVNSNLASFEAVMQAMDEELNKANAAKRAAKSKSESQNASKANGDVDKKGKGKAVSLEDDMDGSDSDVDIEEALRSELKDALEQGGDEDQPQDYAMMLNFLESFKSQGGSSGPVGNLAGLLDPGWKLPRDAE